MSAVGARRGAQSRKARSKKAILDAATAVFLRHGYGGSSMDAIARAAGVSKQTVYHHFGSKEALFGAIVRARCDHLLGPLAAIDVRAQGPRAALLSLAARFVEVLLTPSSLALYRVLMAEAVRFPELGRISYLSGPAVAVETLAHYLADQTRLGRLAVAEPRLAAEQFFGALTGHLQIRALLGVDERPSQRTVERAIEHAVDTFLRAFRPPPKLSLADPP